MKEFLFVYRNDNKSVPRPSAEEGQAIMKKWIDWMETIAGKGKLSDRGNPLGSEGKVVRANNIITDGPYTEIKELIGGYTLVKADSIDEAAELAKRMPYFGSGRKCRGERNCSNVKFEIKNYVEGVF